MPLRFGLELENSDDFAGYGADLISLSHLFESGEKAWGTLLMQVGYYFLAEIEKEFEAEGNYKAGGWPDWALDYEGGSQILTNSGAYRESFYVDPIDDFSVIVHTPEFEDTLHMWHTFGTDDMPPRPTFIVTEEDLAMVDEMFAKHFDAIFFQRLTLGGE